MENQVLFFTKQDLKSAFREAMAEEKATTPTDFKNEKLSPSQAAEFAEMSTPTFNRRVRSGIFKKHGSGRKVFYIKSEIIEALKNSDAR